MKLPNILGRSQLKSRNFSYQPRFYDEKKEEREWRRKEKEQENDQSIDGSKRRISKSFQQSKDRANQRKAASRQTNKRIIGIVIILLALFYFLIVNFLPQILNKLSI